MTALIFDCDGVLAETERHLHLPAFNRAFEEFGVPVHWSDAEYALKLLVAGGKERMATSLNPEFAAAHGLATDPADVGALLEALHARKTELFAELLRADALPARPGIARIIQTAHGAGWPLGVASTSAESAVRAVVGQVLGPVEAKAVAIFAGDVVRAKKPDPEIYELAIDRMRVSKEETLVIEDSRNGLLAASAAGLRCIVTISDYTSDEDFSEAVLVLSSLGDPGSPMRVITNRTTARPSGFVTLEDLEAIATRCRPFSPSPTTP